MTATDSADLPGGGGGAWTAETHQALYGNNFNAGLASYLVETIAPTSVLEFGSGLGHLARYLSDHLPTDQIYCIEPDVTDGAYRQDAAPRLMNVDIFHDTLPEVLQRQFDAVITIEVAEHIERSLHQQLFDFLTARASRWIIFSAAWIGQQAQQGGHGHIAERDELDWRGEFLRRDFEFLPELTEQIRASCDQKNINHRTNLQVFRRRSV